MMAGMSEAHGSSSSWTSWRSLPGNREKGKQIAPGSGERESWSELIIPGRLRDAIARINPKLPRTAVDDAVKIVLTADVAGCAGREPADARVPDQGHPVRRLHR